MLVALHLHYHHQNDVPPGPIYVRPEAVDALGYDGNENVVVYMRSGAHFVLAEPYSTERVIELLGVGSKEEFNPFKPQIAEPAAA